MQSSAAPAAGSVDNALRILLLLSERQSLRVADAAMELGVARSTAHRLLTALVDREFAVKDAHRAYHPGPVLGRTVLATTASADLRAAFHSSLERLNRRLDETCHLGVLEGNGLRFIDCVESSQVLRTGSRLGMLLPAHTNSAGKALLAELSAQEFLSLYPRGVPSSGYNSMAGREVLHRRLADVRRLGYATNTDESTRGVTAVGCCVRGAAGQAVAAIAVACPTTRCSPTRLRELARVLMSECDLASRRYSSSGANAAS